MRDSRTYTIFPSNLSLPEAFRASGRNLVELGYAEKEQDARSFQYEATIDDTRTLSASTWREFLAILDRCPNPQRIMTISHWNSKERADVGVMIVVSSRKIEINIDSSDLAVLELIHQQIRENFHASNAAPEKSPMLSKRNLKKTVFLAYRFDEHGRSTAATVRRLLQVCGFSVVEGDGYEARNVTAKVEERIERQDLLLAIVTPGDDAWIV
jgi:hypothetical protein